MTRKTIILLLLVCALQPAAFASKKDSTKASLNRYSLAIGAGWVHYINTLEIGADMANINSAGLSLKFFWEPEHRLSLGLELGFYRLYAVKGEPGGKVTMSAVPLLLNVRMRIVDHFHLSAGAGLALMFNNITGGEEKISSTILSLSNYQFSASYIYPLDRHWNVGGEFKFINFGKTADWLYTLQVVCAVKL
ncbi:MAG TPA: hypothetical protein PKN44_01440 [Bacteroidales bacterium]|nr:hypothetical protein [Bacteroidales bacterium]HPS49705.1 hypothetical protein [Bacteroidales bacterium]